MKQEAALCSSGQGIAVPPELAQVTIYFIQKDRTENEAMAFYMGMFARKWRNSSGNLIKNWKQHAWAWILNN